MPLLIRELSERELDFVSGGEWDGTVTASRIASGSYSSFGGNWRSGDASRREDFIDSMRESLDAWAYEDNDGDGIPNIEDKFDDTMVVTADRMTMNQQDAYDAARQRAIIDVNASILFGIGAIGALSAGGWVRGALGAMAGFEFGENIAANRDALIDSTAQFYYDSDGLDGRYDGVGIQDRYSPIM
jgi:hypothetical protein